MRMQRIFVCSPLRGDVEANLKAARFYCQNLARNGFLPIAPHLLMPQFLDDDRPAERELGIAMGLELLRDCSEVWVYQPETGPSEGMRAEIAEATARNIPIRYFKAI